VTTTGQLARRAVDLTAAVQNANARIVAIDCILDAAEAGDPDPACTGPR
jgi:hypothetical protein